MHGCGRGFWRRWWPLQDGRVAVFRASDEQVVGVAGSRLRFGEVVGDRRGLGVVGPPQGAPPNKMARFRLVQPPPARGLELVVMSAKWPGVGFGSEAAENVVEGVI